MVCLCLVLLILIASEGVMAGGLNEVAVLRITPGALMEPFKFYDRIGCWCRKLSIFSWL